MRKITGHTHEPMAGSHVSMVAAQDNCTSLDAQLDVAIDQFTEAMTSIEAQGHEPGADWARLNDQLRDQVLKVEAICRAWEHRAGDDQETIRRKQEEFRRRTDKWFATSYFMQRARTWPRGYPGDFEIIERAYDGQPLSSGLGRLLDQYFLTTTLAHAIRYRRALMRELLAEKMRAHHGLRILNIGCGPCREIVELASVIRDTSARAVCVDHDPEALAYATLRLNEHQLQDHVELRRYNALRMVHAQRNVREFGRFDVIYAIGLLDYLADDAAVRLLNALHGTLKPGGELIAVFKDCDRYDTTDYHWLVHWTGFLQRTRHQSWRLLQLAGLPCDAVTVQRSQDDVMIFYRALCRVEPASHAVPPPPHDRRNQVIDPLPRQPEERPDRGRRETPSERRRR